MTTLQTLKLITQKKQHHEQNNFNDYPGFYYVND
jgi:hypothetical protein